MRHEYIDDLSPLFKLFAEQLPPTGQVIVSVLNPFFWHDLPQKLWWKPYLRSLKTHRVVCSSEAATQYRHYISRVVDATRPHFVKVEQAGVATFFHYESGKRHYQWDAPQSLPERVEVRYWRKSPLRHVGKFIFLRFQRTEVAA